MAKGRDRNPKITRRMRGKNIIFQGLGEGLLSNQNIDPV
jgi:hypothetical protein